MDEEELDYLDNFFDSRESYDVDDDWQERRENELIERASECACGAWKQLLTGEVIHEADCCCGAE